MKNRFFCFILLFLMMTAYTPSALKAADISVGATTWYAKWETPDSMGFELKDPAFLYGPVMSAKFNDDWSFTLVFLYGQFKGDKFNDELTDTTIPANIKVDRYDSDAALNYRLNNYLKIFAGTKYMGYKYDFLIDDFPGLPGVWATMKADEKSFGPGGGLSGVFPLGNDFYILGNISAMYLWGDFKLTSANSVETTKYSDSTSIRQYGLNTGASIAYYISAASTTISLGGRYQIFKTEYDDHSITSSAKDTNKFWGATLSATYTFSI